LEILESANRTAIHKLPVSNLPLAPTSGQVVFVFSESAGAGIKGMRFVPARLFLYPHFASIRDANVLTAVTFPDRIELPS
jgi:hypothetical protein